MKKLLVLHYSQSGQLTDILNSFLKPIIDSGQVELTYEPVAPDKPYPFPWRLRSFIDAMPEAVLQIPCPLKPLKFKPDVRFDAVILAYQVWYLSPSTPICSVLKEAKLTKVLDDTPVITLIGCRNMWLNAHEVIKKQLISCHAFPAANIVCMDRASNLTSIVTILFWMLTGRKERFLNLFPKPGVSDAEIKSTGRFGAEILPALISDQSNPWEGLQERLNRLGAVTVNPSYIVFEQRVAMVFNIWARFIRRKGGPGTTARRVRLRLFMVYLTTAIIVLSPIAAVFRFVLQKFQIKKMNYLMDYYAGNRFH